MDRVRTVLGTLNEVADRSRLAGMARYGIATDRALGVPIPELRKLAKAIGPDHALAVELWRSEIHEARMLASMIDDPRHVEESQMEAWVHDFDSWDLCDQVCGNLFDRTASAFRKAAEWRPATRNS